MYTASESEVGSQSVTNLGGAEGAGVRVLGGARVPSLVAQLRDLLEGGDPAWRKQWPRRKLQEDVLEVEEEDPPRALAAEAQEGGEQQVAVPLRIGAYGSRQGHTREAGKQLEGV